MKTYIGTKILNAKPMTRGDYNTLRGWTLPADENGADEGYLTDNGAGHLQWQPKAVFEDAFAPFDGMDFGMAIAALKMGKRVARAGWNGKGMFLFLIQGSNDIAKLHGYGFGEVVGEPIFRDAIFMRTVDNQLVPWTASQTDVLAEDWQIIV